MMNEENQKILNDVFSSMDDVDEERLLTHEEWEKSFGRKYVILTQKLYEYFDNNTEISKDDYFVLFHETHEIYVDEVLEERKENNG